MQVPRNIRRLKETKVLENYSFMTVLQIFNALISLVIYPYVIRKVGVEAYGVYVFALAIVSYFQILIDFGFDSPSAKIVVDNRQDKEKQSFILSAVFTAKHLLLLPALAVFGIMLFAIDNIYNHLALYLAIFLQVYANILFPSWYFQGMKNMRVVTIIQIVCRLLTIPLIFILIRTPTDITVYALIVNGGILLGGITASILLWHNGLKIKFISINETIPFFKDATPFFLTGLAGKLKEGLLTTIVGLVFGMRDVAIYDLAQKIVSIPRMFTQNINKALFPEILSNPLPERVKKVMRYERLIGVVASILIALLGYPAVILLGGKDMIAAFPLAVVLSLTIYSWLVVGGYLNFVFIPQKKYYYITQNQLVAMLSSLLFCGIGLLLKQDILLVAIALTISGFMEILYCRFQTKKLNININ